MLNKEGQTTDFRSMSLDDMAFGNALDCYYTFKLVKELRNEFDQLNPTFHQFYKEVLKPLVLEFADVSFKGIPVDMETLKSMKKEIDDKLLDLEIKIYQDHNLSKHFNLNSNKHLIEKLYLEFKNDEIQKREGSYNLMWPDETEAGDPKTDREALVFLLNSITRELESRGC